MKKLIIVLITLLVFGCESKQFLESSFFKGSINWNDVELFLERKKEFIKPSEELQKMYMTHTIEMERWKAGLRDGTLAEEDVRSSFEQLSQLDDVSISREAENSHNYYYGFDSNGVFYINAYFVNMAKGKAPLLNTNALGWDGGAYSARIRRYSDGYYYFETGESYNMDMSQLYSFNIGNNRWLPHALIKSEYILKNDTKAHHLGGYNFNTYPVTELPFEID